MLPKPSDCKEPTEEEILADMAKYFEERGITLEEVRTLPREEVDRRLGIDSTKMGLPPGWEPGMSLTAYKASRRKFASEEELQTIKDYWLAIAEKKEGS